MIPMMNACCTPENKQNWIQFGYMVEIRMIGTLMSDDALKSQLNALSGLKILRYIPESTTKAIIEFEYKNYRFWVDNGFDMWQFFVHGTCPPSILTEIVDFCGAKLLGPI